MTDINKLSPRAKKALSLLQDGAQFRYRLERDPYTKIAKFKTNLVKGGFVVRGFGFSTYDELRNLLEVQGGGTSVSTYYGLPKNKKETV